MALPTASDILPKTPAESTVPVESEEIVSETETTAIPDEVLGIPGIYGLLHGAPPAVYVEVGRKDDPEIQTIVENKDSLIEGGFGFYTSNDGKLSVFYNGVYVSPEQLKEADEAGTLLDVAVSFDDLKGQFDGAVSGGLPGQSAAPAGASGPPPPSAGAQRRVTNARLKNLQPGSPTSGASPGAGRVMNNILKSTV